ncbi:ThiF family adenylyltransferase [Legionella sp. W05-934-2]|uniref:HesA/MoeB/ThiF family protein n=1 Tax=Legionella sp. W05-934-2 TaxID=1198649 RepID=UPI0034631100
MNLRIKPFVEYFWQNGYIYYFRLPGISIRIKDESKFIYETSLLLNGDCPADSIAEIVSTKHSVSTNDVHNLISLLDKNLLLESYDATHKREQSRYDKNIEFFGSFCHLNQNKFDIQHKLYQQEIAILGLGGVGSNLLINLACLGFTNFVIVDFDKVELSNLNRQILYNYEDIGTLKATAAKKRITQKFPDLNIVEHHSQINCSEDIKNLVNGADILISAIDTPREKILDYVNTACIESKIPYICGGVDSRWATLFSVLPGISGCLECWKSQIVDSFKFNDILSNSTFQSAIAPNVAIMPMISIVAGLMSNEVIKILTNISTCKIGELIAYDFESSSMKTVEKWGRVKTCGVCGYLNGL